MSDEKQVFGIRTDGVVLNTLRTQALEEGHGFDALDLPTKRSKSNSVNSRDRNDLERSWGIGWEAGIRTLLTWYQPHITADAELRQQIARDSEPVLGPRAQVVDR